MSVGMGVLINNLSYESLDITKYYGAVINKAEIQHVDRGLDKLFLTFNNGKTLVLFDDGQSCCEYRYMESDDNLDALVGYELRSIEMKDGPDVEEDYEVLECQFLEIQTSGSFVTVKNYNSHNGYYGGFSLTGYEIDNGPVFDFGGEPSF